MNIKKLVQAKLQSQKVNANSFLPFFASLRLGARLL